MVTAIIIMMLAVCSALAIVGIKWVTIGIIDEFRYKRLGKEMARNHRLQIQRRLLATQVLRSRMRSVCPVCPDHIPQSTCPVCHGAGVMTLMPKEVRNS